MTENNTPFIEDNDQTRARREHLERIRQLTGNAYPNKFRRVLFSVIYPRSKRKAEYNKKSSVVSSQLSVVCDFPNKLLKIELIN